MELPRAQRLAGATAMITKEVALLLLSLGVLGWLILAIMVLEGMFDRLFVVGMVLGVFFGSCIGLGFASMWYAVYA